ncbi:hypothetical protein [Marinomonas sp. GJ51-6]|uniref:hypothetical protein n=1 Tax=Marinomonas sp. GJ51-6 TaxID=2992802 RepID=UPI00293425F6|nr:hypothetical protein [Marinomonas sp. GJ51-6]WOD06164.1 hypothetical protein ONZ50_10475 [Marinomonas sp. GJ51-6]
MKKAILSTTLTLIPSTIQYKALTKALNYLFRGQSDLVRFDGVIVHFKLIDVKSLWEFECDGGEFVAFKRKERKADVTCLIRSDIALSLYSKEAMIGAIEAGDIQFEGASEHINNINALLYGMNSQKIESLIDHLRKFLRLSAIERKPSSAVSTLSLDINTITANQLDTAEKVNFVRDMALNVELTNLPEALRLMKIAKQARPTGLLYVKKYKSMNLY